MLSLESLITQREAADLLRVTPRTVRAWTRKGIFPRPIRVGRAAYYRPGWVRDFIDDRLNQDV